MLLGTNEQREKTQSTMIVASIDGWMDSSTHRPYCRHASTLYVDRVYNTDAAVHIKDI